MVYTRLQVHSCTKYRSIKDIVSPYVQVHSCTKYRSIKDIISPYVQVHHSNDMHSNTLNIFQRSISPMKSIVYVFLPPEAENFSHFWCLFLILYTKNVHFQRVCRSQSTKNFRLRRAKILMIKSNGKGFWSLSAGGSWDTPPPPGGGWLTLGPTIHLHLSPMRALR